MAMLECKNLHRDYLGTVVLSSISLSIEAGEKVGLVGANGAGKTTLLRALAGIDDDFRGTVVRAPGCRVGYLPQHVEPPAEMRALDFMLEEAREREMAVRQAEEALSSSSGRELEAAMARYQAALDLWEECGGHDAETRAMRTLALVGLEGRELTKASSLSGGERGTLALARVLLSRPTLLALDEPGNHLDFRGLAWLESFLASAKEAVILVSHNRMLLDRCVDRIVEIEGGLAREYAGGYSDYRMRKLKTAAAQGEDWQASRRTIARLELMVARAAELASTHSDKAYGQRLRARRHQLEREKARAVDRPELASSAITATFSGRGASDVKSDYALVVNGYSRAFGERTLFADASFDVLTGERVALVGPNGCGKTTFLREVVERGRWDADDLRLSPGMRTGYVAQDRDGFARGRSVREEFESLGAREQETRGLLRDFGFGRNDPDRAIDSLSGGELNRLQLARAIFLKANFLVLDEPTNHLDLDAREAIEDRLADWDGTLLAVSHDRYFLEKVTERVVYVVDGRFECFEGSFSEFWRAVGSSVGAPGTGSAGRNEGIEGRAKSMARSKRAAERSAGADVATEERILALEAEKETLEREIRESFGKREFARAKKLSSDLERLQVEIERMYERWA